MTTLHKDHFKLLSSYFLCEGCHGRGEIDDDGGGGGCGGGGGGGGGR
jgi:hypothetical protein